MCDVDKCILSSAFGSENIGNVQGVCVFLPKAGLFVLFSDRPQLSHRKDILCVHGTKELVLQDPSVWSVVVSKGFVYVSPVFFLHYIDLS